MKKTLLLLLNSLIFATMNAMKNDDQNENQNQSQTALRGLIIDSEDDDVFYAFHYNFPSKAFEAVAIHKCKLCQPTITNNSNDQTKKN